MQICLMHKNFAYVDQKFLKILLFFIFLILFSKKMKKTLSLGLRIQDLKQNWIWAKVCISTVLLKALQAERQIFYLRHLKTPKNTRIGQKVVKEALCFKDLANFTYINILLMIWHRSLETRINLSADLYNISPAKNRPF